MQAHKDAGKTKILTQASTIQRVSQRILLCYAKIIPDVKDALRDISQAYTQLKTFLVRDIYVKYLPELGLPDITLLNMVRPLYGIPEAGTHLFDTYHRHHTQTLNMVTSTINTCLLFSKNAKNDKGNFGIVGL